VAWADPVVQGVYADGVSIASPGTPGNLSTLQPVLVAGKGADGNMHSIATDNSGNVSVNLVSGGSIAVTNTGTFAVQAAQSGAWAVTANAGTNLNTSALALETGGNLAAIKAAITGTVAVSASALPLPTGAATSALQISGNTSLSAIAASLAGTIVVSAASLPLPTGAATSALQTTGNASLATIAASSVTASTSPVGTEVGQIVRNIPIKDSGTLTTALLAANAVFTSAWQDTELDGANYIQVVVSVYGSNSQTNGFVLQGSNDQGNINVLAQSTISYPAVYAFPYPISYRYWRVIYTNGGTLQTSMSITYTAYNSTVALPTGAGTAGITAPFFQQTWGQINTIDGVSASTIQCPTAFQNSSSYGSLYYQMFPFTYNGASFDRNRAGNINLTTGDTGTKIASFNGATQTNYQTRGATITIILGTVSGSTPTLSAQLQWSPDAGTTWLAYGAALPNLTTSSTTGTILVYPSTFNTGASEATPLALGSTVNVLTNGPLPRTWRLAYTIAGASASFAIGSVNVNYIQ
jgi:hypothetical protein